MPIANSVFINSKTEFHKPFFFHSGFRENYKSLVELQEAAEQCLHFE